MLRCPCDLFLVRLRKQPRERVIEFGYDLRDTKRIMAAFSLNLLKDELPRFSKALHATFWISRSDRPHQEEAGVVVVNSKGVKVARLGEGVGGVEVLLSSM